jgi:geranylgeranyl reductase family protein
MTTLETEVLVVGGGPAGAAAATLLARNGVATTLIDKARFPRDKCCGDGLTTGALRRLEELGLDPRVVPSFTRVDRLALRSPRGRTAALPLSIGTSVSAAVARRRELDAALVEVAERAGASVRTGSALASLDVPTDGARCRAALADGTSISSRIVIAADGAWSRVRSELNATPALARPARVLADGWHAWRGYAHDVSDEASGQLWVWFQPDLLPGYAWSFPLSGGIANIGICMLRREGVGGPALAAAWRTALASPFFTSLLGPRAVLEAPARSWPIPSGIDRAPVTERRGRVFYVGDAAAAADPFTGEGIAQALETAMAAAGAIIRHGVDDPLRAASAYRDETEGLLGLEQRVGRRISSLLTSPRGTEAAIRIVGLNRWTRRNAGRWLYEAYPRTVPFQPAGWHRGALSPATPYERATSTIAGLATPSAPVI